jgi:hypothetical protein
LLTLFDLSEAGPDPFNGLTHPRRPCTPAPIGSGPAGETCGTCDHLARLAYAKTYRKCGLMRRAWTGGPATDIRAGWSACKEWRPQT